MGLCPLPSASCLKTLMLCGTLPAPQRFLLKDDYVTWDFAHSPSLLVEGCLRYVGLCPLPKPSCSSTFTLCGTLPTPQAFLFKYAYITRDFACSPSLLVEGVASACRYSLPSLHIWDHSPHQYLSRDNCAVFTVFQTVF